MANPTNAFGLRPVKHQNGSAWNGATVPCYVSALYATALFIGDPVILTDQADEKDPTGRYPTIIASAGTDGTLIRGVITSFEPTDRDSNVYNPALTGRIANVCMDKDVVYQIRGDGGAIPTSLFPGQNADMIATAAGSTVTGLSGFMLDEGTTTAPTTTQTLTLHILGLTDVPDNALGINTVWEVLLNTPELAAGRFAGITAS